MSETLLKLRSDVFASMEVVTPTAGYTAGQMVKIGDVVGVIAETKTVGQIAVLIYKCDKIIVPKVAGTGITFAAGAKVYFKSANAAVTNASTSNTLCGRCTVAAVAADTTVEIDLNGAVAA
jgi:predicted RecA/RadA family phage recombinase